MEKKTVNLSSKHKEFLNESRTKIEQLKLRIADLELEKDKTKMELLSVVETINKLVQDFPSIYNIPSNSNLYLDHGYFEYYEKDNSEDEGE